MSKRGKLMSWVDGRGHVLREFRLLGTVGVGFILLTLLLCYAYASCRSIGCAAAAVPIVCAVAWFPIRSLGYGRGQAVVAIGSAVVLGIGSAISSGYPDLRVAGDYIGLSSSVMSFLCARPSLQSVLDTLSLGSTVCLVVATGAWLGWRGLVLLWLLEPLASAPVGVVVMSAIAAGEGTLSRDHWLAEAGHYLPPARLSLLLAYVFLGLTAYAIRAGLQRWLRQRSLIGRDLRSRP